MDKKQGKKRLMFLLTVAILTMMIATTALAADLDISTVVDASLFEGIATSIFDIAKTALSPGLKVLAIFAGIRSIPRVLHMFF